MSSHFARFFLFRDNLDRITEKKYNKSKSDSLFSRTVGKGVQSTVGNGLDRSVVGDAAFSVPQENNTATTVVEGTTSILSDSIGNIVNVDGMELNWNGRQLESIGVDGVPYYTYEYNIDGQRVKKSLTDPDTGETTVTEYFYNGEILAGEKVATTKNGETTEYTLAFMYDNNGDYFGFTYNGTPYYYVKNAQNDVIFVVNADGIAVVLYQYDAWGNITRIYQPQGSDMASINPITYRSYYCDGESGFYYLNTRYYVPMLQRFLNADSLVDNRGLITQNLFQYCANNPVCNTDSNGHLFGAILAVGLLTIGMLLLTGCGNTSSPAPVPSTTTPSSPSTTAPATTTSPASSVLTNEQKVFVATISAEARWRADKSPVSSQARRAMAHVVINRVDSREWKGLTLPEICEDGFDAYGNKDYIACMNYLNNRDGSNSYYEQVIAEIIPIYNGEVEDITGGCQMYYTPASMDPPGSIPKGWNFSLLEEVSISGVDPYYEGHFYRYK